ncbi:MAG: hypothetical protein AAFN30_02985, partial [Actinomycetota bacterium]
ARTTSPLGLVATVRGAIIGRTTPTSARWAPSLLRSAVGLTASLTVLIAHRAPPLSGRRPVGR